MAILAIEEMGHRILWLNTHFEDIPVQQVSDPSKLSTEVIPVPNVVIIGQPACSEDLKRLPGDIDMPVLLWHADKAEAADVAERLGTLGYTFVLASPFAWSDGPSWTGGLSLQKHWILEAMRQWPVK